MSSSNARNSSSTSTSTTLRPRAKRLISGLDEGDETAFDPNNAPTHRIASPVPSPYDSRSASPIPSAHPQRSPNERRKQANARGGSPVARALDRQRRAQADTSPSISTFWGSSWTTLQGLASDLLGTDITNDKTRARRPQDRLQSGARVTSAPPGKWGPNATTSNPKSSAIGAGTKEQQTADFRARKRKDMLLGQETSYADSMGKFKRRLSDERYTSSAPPGESEDRDALVYVHHVKKDDTLAGITIKYNISANALRKANRMWPNDTIQTRQTLILPVSACSVKGKPVGTGNEDLFASENESLSTLQAEEVTTPTAANLSPNTLNGFAGHQRSRTNSSSAQTLSSALASSTASEPPWHHDSWVMLPGNSKPTEIARMSRRTLGYFPPARRKSIGYSDQGTPSTSLELTRNSSDTARKATASPSGRSGSQNPTRARRLSNANNGYFPAYLTGPGGVGTMKKNVRFPGPAQDGLNKVFARHLPDVAPPRNQKQLYQPDVPLYTDEPTPVGSGEATPAYANAQGPNLQLNLENLGGTIESWVRKLATKAVVTPQERAARASIGTPGKGAGDIGDLIEMTNEFQIGDDEHGEETRGRQGSPRKFEGATPVASSATSYFDGAAARRGTSGTAVRSGKSSKSD